MASPDDLDLQAVEGIPKDTLVALLKRKDKELKTLTGKLEKLEERYVKVVRFNKILTDDRCSFMRYCRELLPQSDELFEEAAAQETPVNLDALLRQLAARKATLEAMADDREVFRQFVELVFSGDEQVLKIFKGPSIGADASDLLQHRWIQLEDLHNQSIASINSMAREQVLSRATELEQANAARREAERKAEELREQLTALAREKAQALKQKLQGGSGWLSVNGPDDTDSNSPSASPPPAVAAELRELAEQRAAAERREREVRENAERRERELQQAADTQRAEVRQLRAEIERLQDESERHRAHAKMLMEQKDAVLNSLQQRTAELEHELGSVDFIARLAEQQAGREMEVRAQQRQMMQLNQTLAEIQRLLELSYSQERVLKDRIRELEHSHGRGHVAGDYLKHVVLKYIQYCQNGDSKAQPLVPVLCTLLNFSAAERQSVESSSFSKHLLLLNQAVGGAANWLGGSPEAPGRAQADQANLAPTPSSSPFLKS